MEIELALHYDDVVVTLKLKSRTNRGHSTLTNHNQTIRDLVDPGMTAIQRALDPMFRKERNRK